MTWVGGRDICVKSATMSVNNATMGAKGAPVSVNCATICAKET